MIYIYMSNKSNKKKHPELRDVKVIMVNGDVKNIRMAYNKDVIQLEVDSANHRAWQKGAATYIRSSKVKLMMQKYGGNIEG